MDSNRLVATRQSLHLVAERVLSADLARRTGRVGLRATPGGFGQPEMFDGRSRHRLRVDGTRLVRLEGETETSEELTTLSAAARFASLAPEPEATISADATVEAGAPLVVDPAAATLLAGWFELGEVALEEVRRRHMARSPSIVQLWPEHFDLACSMAEVNLGASPGDDEHPRPYLYVGPWHPVEGGPWNEPWGMSLPGGPDLAVAEAVEFLDAGFAAALRSS